MIGDRIIPKPHHTNAAREIYAFIEPKVKNVRAALNIAGESGSGKSEIAAELKRFLDQGGIPTYIFAQDDYFRLPPKSNERARLEGIDRVGTSEVKLDLLDEHLASFTTTPDRAIVKPLVIYDEDRITEETLDPSAYTMAIAEGTYTTLLRHSTFHVFIDRTHVDTLTHRQERSREKHNEFYDRVLSIEHEIISGHKERANIIVNSDYSVRFTEK